MLFFKDLGIFVSYGFYKLQLIATYPNRHSLIVIFKFRCYDAKYKSGAEKKKKRK